MKREYFESIYTTDWKVNYSILFNNLNKKNRSTIKQINRIIYLAKAYAELEGDGLFTC